MSESVKSRRIETDRELHDKLLQVARLYKAVRHQFSKIVVTEKGAAKFVVGTGRIVDELTLILSEIEEYSGAAEIRRLSQQMRDIRRRREGSNGA